MCQWSCNMHIPIAQHTLAAFSSRCVPYRQLPKMYRIVYTAPEYLGWLLSLLAPLRCHHEPVPHFEAAASDSYYAVQRHARRRRLHGLPMNPHLPSAPFPSTDTSHLCDPPIHVDGSRQPIRLTLYRHVKSPPQFDTTEKMTMPTSRPISTISLSTGNVWICDGADGSYVNDVRRRRSGLRGVALSSAQSILHHRPNSLAFSLSSVDPHCSLQPRRGTHSEGCCS